MLIFYRLFSSRNYSSKWPIENIYSNCGKNKFISLIKQHLSVPKWLLIYLSIFEVSGNGTGPDLTGSGTGFATLYSRQDSFYMMLVWRNMSRKLNDVKLDYEDCYIYFD
jgi:hypothetical protein